MSRFVAVLVSALVGLLMVGSAPAGAARAPAARAIVVEVRRDVWLPPELRTVDLAGSNKLTVAKELRRGGRGRWSPDGLRIGGYQKPTGSGQWDVAIMSVRADGTDERTVLTGAAFDGYNVARGHKPGRERGFGRPFGLAAYSPSGGVMVFSGVTRYEGPTTDPLDDRYQHRLFVVDLASGAITAVTDGDGEHDDFDPYWSWTLGRIVFVRSATYRCGQCEGIPDRIGQQQLWTVKPDGTDLRQLTTFDPAALPSGTGKGLAAPVWSPDGTRIALVGGLEQWTLYSGDLWLLAVDSGLTVTSASALRAAAGVAEWHPAWSPGGDRLVYARLSPANSREERSEIVLLSPASGAETVIIEQTKQVVFQPDWNPVVPVPTP
jgi:Tol biopolymer transport system component